jgi:hypothetical protein
MPALNTMSGSPASASSTNSRCRQSGSSGDWLSNLGEPLVSGKA